MNFNYNMPRSFIKFDGKQEGKDENNNANILEPTEEAPVKQPELKPVTLSIQDVLASYSQGGLKVISMTGNNSLPPIEEGVTEFVLNGSEITTYKRKSDLSIQIRGKVDINDILGKLPRLQPIIDPIVPNNTDNSNGVNGEIDEKVSQGGTGDCWILTGVLALNASAAGKSIIKEAIQSNPDGSVTVSFKGLGVSYTITADEIKKHDTDNIKNDPYSNGDNDMLVLELATKKLMADIASGKVKLNVPEDSVEAIYNEDGGIEGGFAQNMIYYLTGRQADFAYAYGKETQGLPQNEVLAFLKEAYENGNTALTFGVYGAGHRATEVDGTPYKLDISGGHALAITNLTATTVTFVNPWNSSKEYTMTWDEFAKLGIGMITSTDLSGIEDVQPSNPVDPSDPVDPVEPGTTVYSADTFKDIPQSIVDKYLEPTYFKADGTVLEYTLKQPYTDISFSYAKVSEDGTKKGLIVTLKSIDDNGNEVAQDHYTKESLNELLEGNWWWMMGNITNMYFDYDQESGLYTLKDGKTLDELKECPRQINNDKLNPADPNQWFYKYNFDLNKKIYAKRPVEANLSQGIINRFFELNMSETGEVDGYALKAPYTDFKFVSENEKNKVYEFSYTKDGKIYISKVEIDKTNGNYRITNRQENYSEPDNSGELLEQKRIKQ